MPEGDALHRAAARLSVLEGEVVGVETPHPRAAVLRLAERLDGLRLERVRAVGKNLLLEFEGGLVLRSHLRMRGRWRVEVAGHEPLGKPWLVLRGSERQAVLWNGPVLELTRGRSPAVVSLGPDIMADPADLDGMIARLRGASRGTSATLCSTSGSWPASETCGRRRPSSPPRRRPGAGSRSSTIPRCAGC